MILSVSAAFGSIDFYAGYNDFNMTNININNKGIELTGESNIVFEYNNIIRTYYARLFFNSIPMDATILKGAELLDTHRSNDQRTYIRTEKGKLNVKLGESDSIQLDKIQKGLNEIFVSSDANELFYKDKYYNLTERNYLKENKFIIGNSHFKGYIEEMCLSDGYFETNTRKKSTCYEFKLKRITDNLKLYGTVEYKDTKFKLIGGSRIEFNAPVYNTSKELNILVDVENVAKDNNLFKYSNNINFLVSDDTLIINDDKIRFDSERFLIKIKGTEEIEIYSGTIIKNKRNLDLKYEKYKKKITLYGNENIWNQFIIVNENLTKKETFAMLNNYNIDEILNISLEKKISAEEIKDLPAEIKNSDPVKDVITDEKTIEKEKKTHQIIVTGKTFEEEEKKETSFPYKMTILTLIFFGGVGIMIFKPEWITGVIGGFK